MDNVREDLEDRGIHLSTAYGKPKLGNLNVTVMAGSLPNGTAVKEEKAYSSSLLWISSSLLWISSSLLWISRSQ